MWPFTRHRKRDCDQMHADLAGARRERELAEQRLAVTQRDLIVPLKDMHKENHIDPLIRGLIRRRAAREATE